jgi:hypothetical protein
MRQPKTVLLNNDLEALNSFGYSGATPDVARREPGRRHRWTSQYSAGSEA